MAENRVELIVDARAAAADADIDLLKAKLNDLGRVVATARANVDDKDSQLKLARMEASLLRIGRQVSSPKIKVDGAAKAEADILGVEHSLDKLNDKGPGILSRLGSAFVSLGASAGGLASTIGFILVPLGALVAIVTGPLIAGLGLVAAGFAAFTAAGMKDIPEMKGRLKELKDDFKGLQDAVKPEVGKAFSSFLDIVKQLLPAITPLAKAAGKALDGFLKNIDNWLKSDSGKKFIKWMESDGPHAIATFGRVMWDVAQAIGRTFDFLRNAGNSWFRNVRAGLGSIHAAWSNTANFFVRAGHDIEHVFDNLKGWVGDAVNFIVGKIGDLTSALSSINGALGGIPGKVLSAMGMASGGIVGAAAGGGPKGGMTWVGEQGPELVRLPLGSTVYPHGQSMGMAAQQGGGGGRITLEITDDGSDVGAMLRVLLSKHIRVRYGGNVNAALRA